jgi:hypothetical protein
VDPYSSVGRLRGETDVREGEGLYDQRNTKIDHEFDLLDYSMRKGLYYAVYDVETGNDHGVVRNEAE